MAELVGYILNGPEGEVQRWGGIWGQVPGVPNPLFLPNGDQVCAATIETDYGGYRLSAWLMDKPDEIVRAEGFKSDPARSGLLNRLQTATPTQIDNWVDNTVVDLPSARTVLKMIIKVIALDART